MDQRIILLRGVNVGGVKLPMADLRALAQGLGLDDPRTLLASGNLVARADLPPAELERAMEAALETRFGRPIDVLVRTPGQWRALIEANPMPTQAAQEPSRLMAVVMKQPAGDAALDRLRGFATDGERVERGAAGDLYVWFPQGVGRSKLGERLTPRGLGAPGTARNWNTALKLAELVDA